MEEVGHVKHKKDLSRIAGLKIEGAGQQGMWAALNRWRVSPQAESQPRNGDFGPATTRNQILPTIEMNLEVDCHFEPLDKNAVRLPT